MLNATMYQGKRCTSQPGTKLTTASTAIAHGGSSSEAARKTTRLGWKEKFAGAKTSNRFPTAQSRTAMTSSGTSSDGPGSSNSSAVTAPAASARIAGM